MSERKNHHITSGLMGLAGNPFFLAEKHEQERIIEHSSIVVSEDRRIQMYLSETPNYDDLIKIGFKKSKTLDFSEIDSTSQNSCIECKRVVVIESPGCLNVMPVFSEDSVSDTEETEDVRLKNRQKFLEKLKSQKISWCMYSPHIRKHDDWKVDEDGKTVIRRTQRLRKKRKAVSEFKVHNSLENMTKELVDPADFFFNS